MTENKKKREYSAPALEKGFEILELLAEEQKPMSLVQISNTLNRSKSELYRMLSALEKMGYLCRNEGSDYFHITNRLFDLGLRVPPVGTLVEAAYPIMRELAATISQSCHIAVESQNRMVVVAKVENPGSVGFSVHLGHHLNLHESGSGQVLLAWKSDSQQVKALDKLAAENHNCDIKELKATLQEIRKRGFAKVKSPIIQGLHDISYPITAGDSSHIIGTLTVPFLKNTQSEVNIAVAEKYISETAALLSELSLSYSGQF